MAKRIGRAASSSHSAEMAQWDIAALMLEAHGNDVGNVLLNRIRAIAQAGHEVEAQMWLEISEKVQRLFGTEGAA